MTRRRGSHRETRGRYSSMGNATTPNGLPHQGDQGKHEIMHGLVDDPNPAFRGHKQRTAINAKTDALETEYARGRIAEDAYRAGRVYQRILERSGGRPSGGGQWMEGDRVDAATAHEVAILHGLDSARAAHAMIFDLLPVIGIFGANLLRMTLLDRMTIAQVATLCAGSSGRMDVIYYAESFRRALREVADHWAKTKAPDH